MRARCRRAPLPLYTGNPAPVIFTPSSKSMRSYLRANSQWGRASAGKSGMTPPERSTTLSSAVRPLGHHVARGIGYGEEYVGNFRFGRSHGLFEFFIGLFHFGHPSLYGFGLGCMALLHEFADLCRKAFQFRKTFVELHLRRTAHFIQFQDFGNRLTGVEMFFCQLPNDFFGILFDGGKCKHNLYF